MHLDEPACLFIHKEAPVSVAPVSICQTGKVTNHVIHRDTMLYLFSTCLSDYDEHNTQGLVVS